MFCSVIIPTIGRDTVARAVHSVLDQDFQADTVQVIVVNDSGRSLPKAAWQQLPEVQLITTNRRERCVARNAGAAVAKGKYLCFLDDDDWLLPGSLNEFWQLTQQQPRAIWLYGGIRVVDEANHVLAEINSGLKGNCFAQIMGGAWAPIQTSIMQSQAFFALGGFNPEIIGTEDLDLTRKFAYYGDFANTTVSVACLLRGTTWDTSTDYLRAPIDTLKSRDAVINQPGSFKRMVESANSSYWHGRILRVYLSTFKFHLRQKNYFSAISRGMYGLMGIIRAGKQCFNPDYWQGVKADHPPDTLHFVIKELENK